MAYDSAVIIFKGNDVKDGSFFNFVFIFSGLTPYGVYITSAALSIFKFLR